MPVKMDLHCHSTLSDGTFTPAELVCMAKRANIALFALADHDTMAGIPEAQAEARVQGITFFPAVELDCESPFELHILGLDVNPGHAGLQAALEVTKARRAKRNAVIVERLAALGCDIGAHFQESEGNTTRLHIAKALQAAGYAKTVTDAFTRYLTPGRPAYYAEPRYTPEKVIALIIEAGGIPTLAHPCHIRSNPHALVAQLCALGLRGIEAYYPTSTLGQTELFVSLAQQYGLLVTCGSDFHGRNREGTPLGCAWRNVPYLQETAEILQNRYKNRL